MHGDIVLRPMQLKDIEGVWEVDQAAFSMPWSKEAFYNELTMNHTAHYLVLLVEEKIRGYAGMWLILDEAHVTNIAVHPLVQGQKLGELLLGTLMLLAKTRGAKRMTLEVRTSNDVAQNLYKKMGFVKSGVRPHYYSDNMEDALIMWAELNDETLARLEEAAGKR